MITDEGDAINPTLQTYVMQLSFMQQSVLLSAIRGMDGLPKLHAAKKLLKWYRRCILLSAFDRRALTDPFEPGGGSFTGPIAELPEWEIRAYWIIRTGQPTVKYEKGDPKGIYDWKCAQLELVTSHFIDARDEFPLHYYVHTMHAFEILGYKHPDETIREFWNGVYLRMVHALHLWPETVEQMDRRLGDDFDGWQERNDISTSCSD